MKINTGSLNDTVGSIIIICFEMLIARYIYLLFITSDTIDPLVLIFLYCFLIPSLIFIPIIIVSSFEKYYLYEDRLVSRNIYGIKNITYFKDVKQVKEVLINKSVVYIFDDGRKDNKFDGLYTAAGRHRYNNDINFSKYDLRYNFRITKCEQIKDYIEKELNLPIIKYNGEGEKIDNE